MLIAQVVSFTVAVTVFVYLIGSTLASPVGQVILADESAVTTVVPEAALNDDAATTPVADEPTQTTGDSVTQRARQDEDEDDDDDDSTAAPVVTTRAPIVPPRRNESTILNEFNFAGQLLNPVDAKPKVPLPVDEEGEAAVATEKSAGIDVEESEDNDRDNEITQDEVGTTAKVPTFESEYHYTIENFNKNVIKNKQREEQEGIGPGDDGARHTIPIMVNDVQNNDSDSVSLTTLSPAELEKESVSNYSEYDNLEYSFQPLHDGEGRAGCECGKIPFKIPVDSESQINPTPWLAAVVRGGLFAGGRPHCAGTLVNNLYVLTSASCMDGLYPTSIQVWLTAHDSFEHHQASFGNIKMNVQEIIMHPNYDRRSKNNDLCLLKLAHAVDISANSYFVPACLPAGSFNFAGSVAKVSGWSDGRAYRVCKADMPILDNNVCDRDTRHKGKITGNMVCAGYLTPTRVENCIGDAGGPLVSPNSGRATLVGVVSWGYEAKNRDYTPTVYTRVSEFSDWILHNTRDADWCGV